MAMVQVAVIAHRDADGTPGPAIPLYREVSDEEAANNKAFLDAAAQIMAEKYIMHCERRRDELEEKSRREAEKRKARTDK